MSSTTAYFPSQTVALPLITGEITPATVGVFQQIWREGRGRPVRIAESRLATRLTMSKRTLRRHLKRLADIPMLRIQRNRCRANTYTPLQASSSRLDLTPLVQLVLDGKLSRHAARTYSHVAEFGSCGDSFRLWAGDDRTLRRRLAELRTAGLIEGDVPQLELARAC